MEKSYFTLKKEAEGLRIQYDLCVPVPLQEHPGGTENDRDHSDLESEIREFYSEYENTLEELDRLTNHADSYDYMLAVSAGLLSGLVDMFFVGEWNFKSAKVLSYEEINRKVIDFAKKDPEYANQVKDPNRLESAVRFLENKYKLPGDNDWNTKKKFTAMAKEFGFVPEKGTGKFEDALKYMRENHPNIPVPPDLEQGVTANTHHLDDICHHPTLVGMMACILVQFSGTTRYCPSTHPSFSMPVEVNDYGLFVSRHPLGKVFSGIVNWFFTAAKAMQNQKGHLYSDMAGSSGSTGNGAGIPGTFLSFLKGLSMLPCFSDSDFAEKLRKAYQNGIGTKPSQLDLGALNLSSRGYLYLHEEAPEFIDSRPFLGIGFVYLLTPRVLFWGCRNLASYNIFTYFPRHSAVFAI